MTEGSGHSFDTGTPHVVVGILLGERPSRGLAVRTEHERLRILSAKALDHLSPEHTRSTHLSDLHKVVDADAPEEGETWRKLVHRDTCVDTSAEVLDTVSDGKGDLDVGRSTSLLHVIARDGDRVELRHLLRGVLKDVGDDLHREFRRIDVGVAHHELLEDIVLNGTSHLLELSALL